MSGRVGPARALAGLVVMAAIAVAGCARTFGNYYWPDKCEPKGLDAAKDLEKAPMWVPGSAESARVGTTSCKAHHHPDDMDRLCAVGEKAGVTSSDLAMRTALQLSRVELQRRVRSALETMLDGQQPGGGQGLDALAFQITAATGKVADTWVSPNCTAFALTELQLEHFEMVIQPADVSDQARTRILARARAAFEE